VSVLKGGWEQGTPSGEFQPLLWTAYGVPSIGARAWPSGVGALVLIISRLRRMKRQVAAMGSEHVVIQAPRSNAHACPITIAAAAAILCWRSSADGLARSLSTAARNPVRATRSLRRWHCMMTGRPGFSMRRLRPDRHSTRWPSRRECSCMGNQSLLPKVAFG